MQYQEVHTSSVEQTTQRADTIKQIIAILNSPNFLNPSSLSESSIPASPDSKVFLTKTGDQLAAWLVNLQAITTQQNLASIRAKVNQNQNTISPETLAKIAELPDFPSHNRYY